jgi:hypothetical protein
MSYVTDEASVESGAPIELFEFIGSDPSVNTFRYTTADADVTFDPGDGGGSRTFYAIPMKRSGVVLKADGSDPSIVVTLPTDSALARRYVFQIAPPDLYLTVFRCHINVGTEEVITAWEGDVISWSVQGNLVEFTVPNDLAVRVEESIPKVKYQRYCNNSLYDAVCGVPKSGDNVLQTSVASFPDEKKVAVNNVGGKPNGYWDGGEIRHDATGESRMILTHFAKHLTILYPFSANVDINETVTLARGCNHSLQDCRTFNLPAGNTDNFTGFALVSSQQTDSKQGK